MIHNRQGINIPGRSLTMVNVSINPGELLKDQVFEVKPNFLLTNEHPNLIVVPMLYNIQGKKYDYIALALINLNEDEKIFLRKGEVLRHLEPCSIEINEIVKEDWSEMEEIEGKENEAIPLEKKFITSPAEVNTHRKMQLQDAEVAKKYKQQFKQLCKEFGDIFSKDSTDIGKTPLITMDIDTGETLEKAGVIVRSISPWASPIVVVPKKTEPGEPPRRRLCVD